MISYIFNLVLCSAAFLGYYFLILERERNHHFKRFYLLATLIGSLLIPLITITYEGKSYAGNLIFSNENSEIVKANANNSTLKFAQIAGFIWISISVILLIKFFIGLLSIRKKINRAEKIPVQNAVLVLLDEEEAPYSFWKWIFLNKAGYNSGKIDPKILLHERAHIKQSHAADLVLCELILAFFWFNPVFYFYKRAISTNHEFLADEAVLNTDKNITEYQNLLLNQLATDKINLTNHFNFYNTKKRFIMMTTPKRTFRKVASALTLPLAAAMVFAFSKKGYAQNQQGQEKPAEVKSTTLQEQASAEYPGGIGAFRTAVSKEFDTSKLKSGEKLQATVVFKIDEKGKASDFRVDGNDATFMNETKRSVQKVAESVTWKPASENGKAISSDFKLPLTMVFETKPFPKK